MHSIVMTHHTIEDLCRRLALTVWEAEVHEGVVDEHDGVVVGTNIESHGRDKGQHHGRRRLQSLGPGVDGPERMRLVKVEEFLTLCAKLGESSTEDGLPRRTL